MIIPRIFKNPLLYLVVMVCFAWTAEDPLEKITAAFKQYLEELPQEKIYIQTDRSYYQIGEKIWFKAYLVAGPLHIPSPLSRTLYVELTDPNQKRVRQVKLLINNGASSGVFSVPDSIAPGDYVIRAYTQWMRNSDEKYFFYRPIKLFSGREIPKPVVNELPVDLQFFPEGGEWVAGLRCKIAFKAVDGSGKGKPIKGKIVDDQGKMVTTIESNSRGMGVFTTVPEKGRTYLAQIDGLATTVRLPPTLDTGITLAVTNQPAQEDVVIRIQHNTETKTIYLVAHTRGIICYASKVALPHFISFVKIPKENFPTGVVQLTLLDEAGLPRAERLFFIDHQDELNVQVKPDKETYSPREKITLSIEARRRGQPVAANFSLAVCDDQQVPTDLDGENICSYFYLSSEVTGTIESPGYYFNAENGRRLEALDELLLTQGWRKFLYQKTWSPPAFPVEQGLTLKGKLISKDIKKPIAEGKVSYLNTFPSADARIAFSDAEGNFEFPNLIYYDSAHAVLQGQTKKGGKYVKFVMDIVSQSPPMSLKTRLWVRAPEEIESDIIERGRERKKIDAAYDLKNNSIMLEGVEVKGKREKDEFTFRNVYGGATATVQVADNFGLEFMQHPLQLIQGRVAGVQVLNTGGDNWSVQVRGTGSILSGTAPLILVNNIPYDVSALAAINVRDIESVDVYKGADTAFWGSRGSNGVIVFYTKTGKNSIPVAEGDGVLNLNLDGFQTPRQFYVPRYDVQRPEHVKPDHRATLYWEPFIATDSTGRATVTFYNHDLKTTLTGVIEGMAPSGVPGKGSFHYSINK